MKEAKDYFILITIITVVAVSILQFIPKTTNIEPHLHSEVFAVNNGYGYNIMLAEKVLIRQDFIPAINGVKPFSEYGQAKMVADKIIHKLLRGDNPVVTVSELEELNIIF